MAVPQYWTFGHTNLGPISVPKRLGPRLNPAPKVVDLFGLQAEPNRTPFGIRSLGMGGGFWEGFMRYGTVDADGLPWPHTPWPTNWKDTLDPALLNTSFHLRTPQMDAYFDSIANFGNDEEEYWFMPNIESNRGEYYDTLPDPFNPTQLHIDKTEYMQQGYRLFFQKMRQRDPKCCCAYYQRGAMLNGGWPYNGQQRIDAFKIRDDRNGYQQIGKRIIKSEGLFDACDAIVAAHYTRNTDTIEGFRAQIQEDMAECRRLRRPGQLIGTYVQPYHLTGEMYTPEWISMLAGELRRQGCQRLFLWGYVSNTPDNQGVGPERYFSYWRPYFQAFKDAFE